MDLILQKSNKIISIYWDFKIKKYNILFDSKKYIAEDVSVTDKELLLYNVISIS